jgi:hypothetical protein
MTKINNISDRITEAKNNFNKAVGTVDRTYFANMMAMHQSEMKREIRKVDNKNRR